MSGSFDVSGDTENPRPQNDNNCYLGKTLIQSGAWG